MMYWVGFKADYWGSFSIYDGDGNENGEKEIALDLQNNGCHLQKKNSENLVGKLTEHDFSESFQWKISVINETSEKVVLFFRRSENSKRKFAFHFLKVIFLYHF